MRLGIAPVPLVTVRQSDSITARNADEFSFEDHAFVASLSVGPVSAKFAGVQLWNPPGSGVRAVLDQLIISSDTSGLMLVERYDTQLTVGPTPSPGKHAGQPNSQCALYSDTVSFPLGTNTEQLRLQANMPQLIDYAHPYVLEENTGLVVWSATVNTATVATAHWREL